MERRKKVVGIERANWRNRCCCCYCCCGRCCCYRCCCYRCCWSLLESFGYGFDSFHSDISLSDEVVSRDKDVVLMTVFEKLLESVAELFRVTDKVLFPLFQSQALLLSRNVDEDPH